MKFTFGIITAGDTTGNNPILEKVLASIERENIPDDCFEVIVVGGKYDLTSPLLKLVSFDETQKKMWITRKKNIITERAQYPNIVYMHDYVALEEGWYEGMKSFGDAFDVCMTPIRNADGSRFRDWTLWGDDLITAGVFPKWDGKFLLPYNVTNLSRHMYISGAYWIAKKSLMVKFPLDESLAWGEGEDVKWSKEVRQQHRFSINPASAARLLKQKDRIFHEATPEIIKQVEDYDATLQPK